MTDLAAPSGRLSRQVRHRVHGFESRLPPLGFLRRFDEARAGGDDELVAAIRDSFSFQALASLGAPQPYRRQALAEDAALYSAGGPPGGRSLLVGLTGRAHRLMLPLPVLLQMLPAEAWDLLLLRDRRQNHYRDGCEGFAGSLDGLARRLAGMGRSYRRLVCLGTSMGGLAAVRLALRSGAERGISFGGRPPNDVLRLVRAGSAFDPLCACLPPNSRPLVFAYAAGCEEDATAARGFAALTGGMPLPVPGAEEHNLVRVLFAQGRLPDFLRQVLNEPPARLAEAGV